MHVYYKMGGYKCIIKVLFGWEDKKWEDNKKVRDKKNLCFLLYVLDWEHEKVKK